jgi:hypothetical protein
VGKYLDILRRAETGGSDKNDKNDKSPPFGRLCRFGRTRSALSEVFAALERRCPDHVETGRWQQAVEDGRRFLAQWGEQAHALGWSARDLFGLHKPPERPRPNYNRLSRYDDTGLVWLLRGRELVALTAATAAIASSTGSITTYRRHNKPALGPVGDSLDDLEPAVRLAGAPHDRP